MAQDTSPQDAQLDTVKPLQASDVAAYIRRHPDFLAKQLLEDSDLLPALAPYFVELDSPFISMPHFIAERMRREVVRLRQGFHQYQQKIQSEHSLQDRLYALVQNLLRAKDFNAILDIITWDIAPTVGLEAAILCVESDKAQFVFSPQDVCAAISSGAFYCAEETEIAQPGVKIIPNGATHLLIDHHQKSRHSLQGSDFFLFPGLGVPMRSEFLVKLNVAPHSQPAFIAFGSQNQSTFEALPLQSRLYFLSHCLEHTLNRLLTDTPLGDS